MSKKILIIDDSEPIVDSLILLFEEFAEKESFYSDTKGSNKIAWPSR